MVVFFHIILKDKNYLMFLIEDYHKNVSRKQNEIWSKVKSLIKNLSRIWD